MKMETNGSASPSPKRPRKKSGKSVGQRLIDLFVPRPGDSSRTLASKIIIDVAVVLVIAALVIVGLLIHKYATAQHNIDEWQGLKPSSDVTSEVSSDPTSSDAETSSNTEDPPESVWVSSEPNRDNEYGIDSDWVEAYEKNSDFVGWLTIPGTQLDLPVVKGSDNSYYLDHTLEKQYNAFGVPFADYRTTISPSYQSDNITIYGHAAANGSFFTPVKQYQDIEFYKEHPILEFDTIYGKGVYKIFAFGIINADASGYSRNPNLYPAGDTFNYHDYNDLTETVFNSFVQEIRRRSYFIADVDIQPGDKIITLSTCDTEIMNSLSTPYRAVLFARKVRDGESVTVDVSQAEPNLEVVMPAAWVKKYGKNTPFD